MKRAGKKKLKIFAVTSMTIFSLLAASTGVFAWFVSKLSANNNADNFTIFYDDSKITTLSCYAIKYDGVYGAVATQLVSGQEHNISMSEYDYIFRDKNVNTPLFFRIEMSGFSTTKDLEITIPCSAPYKEAGHSYIDNSLSNVVCAKFSYGLIVNNAFKADKYELTGSPIRNDTITEIYTGMRENVKNTTGTPFVKSASQKDSQISLSLSAASLYQSSNIAQRVIDGNTVDVVVIYIAFDYYVNGQTNLVEDYITSCNNSHIEPSLTFKPDIGTMTLKDKEV